MEALCDAVKDGLRWLEEDSEVEDCEGCEGHLRIDSSEKSMVAGPENEMSELEVVKLEVEVKFVFEEDIVVGVGVSFL